jgi:hypothetical protein
MMVAALMVFGGLQNYENARPQGCWVCEEGMVLNHHGHCHHINRPTF